MHQMNERGAWAPGRVDLNLLTVFEAVWRERNVARAAVALSLSQPAVSHALGRLRDLVGDPLFERAPGGVRPTLKAEAMWPDVTAALERARAALGRGLAPEQIGRRIRLGITHNVALTLMPALATSLRSRAADVDVALVPIDRSRARALLERGEVDAVAGLWPGELRPPLIARPLYTESLVLAAREDHPILRGRLTMARFAATPQVLVSPSGDARGPVDDVLAAGGLRRRVVLVVSDYNLALEALARSDLVAVLAKGPVDRVGPRLGIGSRALPFDIPPLVIELVGAASSLDLLTWLAGLLTYPPQA